MRSDECVVTNILSINSNLLPSLSIPWLDAFPVRSLNLMPFGFSSRGVPLLLQFKLGQSLRRFVRGDASHPAPTLQRPSVERVSQGVRQSDSARRQDRGNRPTNAGSELRGQRSKCQPFIARHDPFHELVEQRHCECRVPVIGAPDHAFGNELIPRRSQASYLAIELLRYVSRTMRAWPEFSHCPQIALFRGREAIEANPEKTLIKRCSGYL